jgi:hypothetical protein
MIRTVIFALLISSVVKAQNGPYSPAADQPGSNAVSANSTACTFWANGVEIQRGSIHVGRPGAPLADAGDDIFALGKADGSCVSLGDGGVAILTFPEPLQDRPGFDFAVFENGFYSPMDTGYFLELGMVEVSSNGVDFVLFPAHSITPDNEQVGSFGIVDPTMVHNLAGKYATGYGTPFDLTALAGDSNLDINAITHIRISDVVGSIDSAYGTLDTAGNFINDPWPTDFPSGGFDLDAVCALNEALIAKDAHPKGILGVQTVWGESFRVDAKTQYDFEIYDTAGRKMAAGRFNEGVTMTNVSDFGTGIYLLLISKDAHQQVYKCVKR